MAGAMRSGDPPSSAVLRIVVVEETRELAATIEQALSQELLDAHVVSDGERGLELARDLPADLVVLDLAAPGVDGVEACRRLRAFSDAYVIILSARAGEQDRLAGLEAGADDYMTKPFYPRELVARVRAMQRRPRTASLRWRVRRFGALQIDSEQQRVSVDGRAVVLSQTEYRLLDALTAEAGRIFTREELLRRVWGEVWFGDDHLIDVHVSNLRRRLGDDPADPRWIATVRGVGFVMGR